MKGDSRTSSRRLDSNLSAQGTAMMVSNFAVASFNSANGMESNFASANGMGQFAVNSFGSHYSSPQSTRHRGLSSANGMESNFASANGMGHYLPLQQSQGSFTFRSCQAQISFYKVGHGSTRQLYDFDLVSELDNLPRPHPVPLQFIEVQSDTVKRGEHLGNGAYASVYKGRALGIDCAIKVFRNAESAEKREEIMREIKIGSSLDHPCTLRILGWVSQPLQTITELCSGDLRAYYRDNIKGMGYNEMKALSLLREGASGLNYLHSVGIIHRDIKPENILIARATRSAKIGDLGIARVADSSSTMTSTGTLIYLAPEVARGERYGFAADVYSFAITMYEVCHRDIPYSRKQRGAQMMLAISIAEEGTRPPLYQEWDPQLSCLISASWSGDQTLRPSLANIMSTLSTILGRNRSGLRKRVFTKEEQNAFSSPGALFRRVRVPMEKVVRERVIGGGSHAQV